MTINANIPLGVQQPQMPNQLNMLAQVMQVQGAQNQNALAQYSLSKAQRQDQEANALAELMRGGVDLNSPDGQAKAYGVAPLSAAGLIKQQLENRNITSQIGEREAKAKKDAFDMAKQGYGQFQQVVGAHINNPNATPQSVASSVQGLVQAGVMDGKVAQGLLAQMPQDPAQLRPYLQQVVSAQMTPEQLMTIFAPKPTEVNNGQVKSFRDLNPNSPTYGQATGGAPVQLQATPDAMLSSQTQIKTTGMNNATSRANNQATIQKDFMVAGINPDGSANQNVEQMAQAIAAGKAAPITGFALAKPQGQTVMRRVFEINPNYDETTYSAKNAAAKAFTSGQQGNALRSVATANAHLDQLGELVDALNNGNIQVVNRVANAYQTQTGNPAPTNFDAVKNIIGQEVVKAIVAGGGSAGERDEAAKTFSTASSPQQLKQAIQHYRMVMHAQQQNLLEQRRAAGLSDDTLPKYGTGGPVSINSLPSGGASGAGGGRVINFGDLK